MSIPYTETELEELRPQFQLLETYNSAGDVCKLTRLARCEEQMKSYQEFWDKYYEGKVSIRNLYVNCKCTKRELFVYLSLLFPRPLAGS